MLMAAVDAKGNNVLGIDAVAKRMASGREDTILDSIRGESSGIGFAMSKKF